MILTAAALLLGSCLVAAALLGVAAFRVPMPHLARTLTSLRGAQTDDPRLAAR